MSRYLSSATEPAVPRRVSALGTLVVAALGILALAGAVLGVRIVDVLTGSMSPTIPAGSLVLTQPIDADDVRVGDVVAFRPPPGFGSDTERPVLHRVAAIDGRDDGAGAGTLTTKGDANARPDPWRIALDGAELRRQRVHLPLLGWLTAAGRPQLVLLGGGALSVVLAIRRSRTRPAVPCWCPQHASTG